MINVPFGTGEVFSFSFLTQMTNLITGLGLQALKSWRAAPYQRDPRVASRLKIQVASSKSMPRSAEKTSFGISPAD